MVDIFSYVPRSVVMPERYGIKRDLVADIDELDDPAGYDHDTIFYDVFIQPGSRDLVALGPPLLNLERALLPVETYVGVGREFCSAPLSYEIHRGERFNTLRFQLPSKYSDADALSVRFVFKNGFQCDVEAVASRQAPVFLTLATQQRNNRIAWIIDWALYHWKLGVERLILYDNGSDNLDEIVSAFESLPDGPQIVLVHWPFKFGPPRHHGAHFGKAAQLNHAHLFFSQTRWSINLDIDEYLRLEDRDSNLVDDLRAEPPSMGLLRIDSYWVPYIGQKAVEARTVRDFPHRNKEPRGKAPKYILRPEAHKESGTHTAKLKKSFQARKVDPQRLAFLHYVAITTNWKGSYWDREKPVNFDQDLHVEDRSVIDVLKKLGRARNKLKPRTPRRKRSIGRSLEIWSKSVRGTIDIVKHRPLVLHRRRYTRGLPPDIQFAVFCRSYRGKLRRPKGLAMVQVHNRSYKTLLEKNLDYLGIDDYTVLNVRSAEWRSTMKIPVILAFASRCPDEYIFYCDSDDAILTDAPQKALDLLHESGCDMLVSATNHKGGFYDRLPEREQWAIKTAVQDWHRTDAIHLNAGVYVARTKFLVEVLTEAAKFVAKNDVDPGLSNSIGSQCGTSALPNYPQGCSSDQHILRYLHPVFYPRMKIDYSLRLAVRNP